MSFIVAYIALVIAYLLGHQLIPIFVVSLYWMSLIDQTDLSFAWLGQYEVWWSGIMRVPLFRKIYSLILVISGYVYILIWFRTSGHTWSQLTSSQPLLLVLFCHHLHKCTGLHLFVHIIFNIVHYSGPYCILACMLLPYLNFLFYIFQVAILSE